MVLDLETAGLNPSTLLGNDKPADASSPKILAFGPHVHAKRLADARAAGCDEVLSRGEFHAQMDEIFSSL